MRFLALIFLLLLCTSSPVRESTSALLRETANIISPPSQPNQ